MTGASDESWAMLDAGIGKDHESNLEVRNAAMRVLLSVNTMNEELIAWGLETKNIWVQEEK